MIDFKRVRFAEVEALLDQLHEKASESGNASPDIIGTLTFFEAWSAQIGVFSDWPLGVSGTIGAHFFVFDELFELDDPPERELPEEPPPDDELPVEDDPPE